MVRPESNNGYLRCDTPRLLRGVLERQGQNPDDSGRPPEHSPTDRAIYPLRTQTLTQSFTISARTVKCHGPNNRTNVLGPNGNVAEGNDRHAYRKEGESHLRRKQPMPPEAILPLFHDLFSGTQMRAWCRLTHVLILAQSAPICKSDPLAVREDSLQRVASRAHRPGVRVG
jgi:hypothetical protein